MDLSQEHPISCDPNLISSFTEYKHKKRNFWTNKMAIYFLRNNGNERKKSENNRPNTFLKLLKNIFIVFLKKLKN